VILEERTAVSERSDREAKALDSEALKEELEQYRMEKEKIRAVVGAIGGAVVTKRDRVINILFIVAISALFLVDSFRHFLDFRIPLPPVISLELGVLLISIKIIWMIHKQSKVDHFQFWILNSIEFRLNDLAKKMRVIEERLADE
jgi:hypothetical protein